MNQRNQSVVDANHLVLVTDFQTDALRKFAEASAAINDAIICVQNIDPTLVATVAEVLFQIATLSSSVALRAAQRLHEPPTTSFRRNLWDCPRTHDGPCCFDDQNGAPLIDGDMDQ